MAELPAHEQVQEKWGCTHDAVAVIDATAGTVQQNSFLPSSIDEISIGQLFSLIHTLNLKSSIEYQPVLRSLGDALASHLQICLGSASHFPFISEIKAALEANLTAAEFDLPTYLNSLGYNADYIRRCFKQACHVTPLQYLQELRLTYAKKLLTNTNYTIKEIAGLCGYADPYYFSRAFKKHFGAAPHYLQGEKVCDPINRTQPLSNV